MVEFRVKIRKNIQEKMICLGPPRRKRVCPLGQPLLSSFRSLQIFPFLQELGVFVFFVVFFFNCKLCWFFLNIEVIDVHCRAFIWKPFFSNKQKENKDSSVIFYTAMTTIYILVCTFFLCKLFFVLFIKLGYSTYYFFL